MDKKLLATICVGAGVVTASPALFAQRPAGGYIGFSIGEMRADACGGAPGTIRCEDSDTAARLFGGYQFTPYLAGEIGGSLLGRVSASTGESADLSALDASAVGSWPVGNRFALFGRLGAYVGNTEAGRDNVAVETVFPPPPAPRVGWKSGTNTDLTYGLGAAYAFTHNGTFRVEWQRFRNFGGGDGAKMDLDAVSLGGVYRY